VRHPIVVESHHVRGHDILFQNEPGDWLCLIEPDGMKAIWSSEGLHKLFDLETDPDEQHNLLNQRLDVFTNMSAKLQHYLADLPRPDDTSPAPAVDPGTLKTLKSLGYVQ
jgi:hypothetical protein